MKKHSRVCAEIDLDAVLHNFRAMRRKLKDDTQMIAVVKTDGYGHGAVPIAEVLEPLDYIWGFAVATAEEGHILRQAGVRKPVLILGFVFPEDYGQLVREQIRPTVFKYEMARQLSEEAEALGEVLPIHLALDTGMTRIGFADSEESVQTIKRICQLPGIRIEGMFTHFARADEQDKSYARAQSLRYIRFSERLAQEGVEIAFHHCANSASILELPEVQMELVRPGITNYGIFPSDEMDREGIQLQPVMSLKSHIVYIKEVPAGVQVSYGGTFLTTRRTRIATIPVGYGDGYPRSLSNKGQVLIRGKRAPILGRICMDQFMVDVTDIPEAEEFDEAVLMGRSGKDEITVDELGHLSGRFPYEFVCCIGKRVPRVYYRGQ